MNHGNSQAVTSTTWCTTSGSIVTASIGGSNSVEGLAHTATITNSTNDAQEQQRVALSYFQRPNGQNVEGLVSQIINVDGAAAVAWPGASTVDVQVVADLQPANVIQQQDFAVACLQEVQVQDGLAQQIISNDRTFHRRELSPNAINSEQQALVYFQQSNDQNVQRQDCQIINVDGAAAVSWPGASTVDAYSVAELQPANAIQDQDFAVSCLQEVQVQDGHAQQIISNDRTFHRRELSPNAINSEQQALVYFQQSNDQNVQGQDCQIINVDGAAAVSWPRASTVDAHSVAEIQPANVIQDQDFAVAYFQEVQVQDGQAQQIISNDRTLHRHELSPDALAAWAITSSHQQMPLFTRIQTVDDGAQESSHQLLKDCNDTEKWQVLVSATNPATVSIPIQHSQVSESVSHNLAIAATSETSTSAESQSCSALNAFHLGMRKGACTCLYCNGQEEKNKKSKKKEHPCHAPGCTKVYGQISHLRVHYRCHTGERPFVCSWTSCGKTFIRSDHLATHQRTHTGEKNFQCSECFRLFARKQDLSRHFKTIHNKGS